MSRHPGSRGGGGGRADFQTRGNCGGLSDPLPLAGVQGGVWQRQGLGAGQKAGPLAVDIFFVFIVYRWQSPGSALVAWRCGFTFLASWDF